MAFSCLVGRESGGVGQPTKAIQHLCLEIFISTVNDFLTSYFGATRRSVWLSLLKPNIYRALDRTSLSRPEGGGTSEDKYTHILIHFVYTGSEV